MATAFFDLWGGVLLGLASSLHCAGMCGGIAILLGVPDPKQGRLAASFHILARHAGRLASYALLGAVAGGIGRIAVGGMDGATGHLVLRWAAGLSLGWIGLSTAGLMPAPRLGLTGRWSAFPVLARMGMMPAPVRSAASGMVWGLLPCAMIYGALLFALFTGSALRGATAMLGFGLGTLPSLIAVGLGFSIISEFGGLLKRPRVLGALIAVTGMLSLLPPESGLKQFCGQVSRRVSVQF